MTSNVFKSVVYKSFKIGQKFCAYNECMSKDELDLIDALRLAYEKYKTMVYNAAMYPHSNLQVIKDYIPVVMDMAKEANCTVFIHDINDNNDAKNYYQTPIKVVFKNIDITDMINTNQK